MILMLGRKSPLSLHFVSDFIGCDGISWGKKCCLNAGHLWTQASCTQRGQNPVTGQGHPGGLLLPRRLLHIYYPLTLWFFLSSSEGRQQSASFILKQDISILSTSTQHGSCHLKLMNIALVELLNQARSGIDILALQGCSGVTAGTACCR
eukprot:Em0009g403a